MTKAKRLNIRITFPTNKQPPKEQAEENETVYVYNWPRIITATLLALVVFAFGFYFFYSPAGKTEKPVSVVTSPTETPDIAPSPLENDANLSQAISSPQNENNTTEMTSEKTEQMPVNESQALADNTDIKNEIADAASKQTEQMPVNESQALADNTDIKNEIAEVASEQTEKLSTNAAQVLEDNVDINNEIAEITSEQTDQLPEDKTTALTHEQAPPLSASAQQIEADAINNKEENIAVEERIDQAKAEQRVISSDITNYADENDETILSEKITPANTDSLAFSQPDISIFSNQVQRFLIASNVNDKEPVGSINDIKFDNNNLATVYAYSDVIGMLDEFLYYTWYLNDQEIARVKVGVWANRWRSYASKFIQSNKYGNWKITLENTQGNVLATAQFQYVK